MRLLFTFIIIGTSLATAHCQTADDYLYSGISKDKLQDYRGAITDYTKAIELDPNRVVFYFLRGNAKERLQDYRGAIADYTTVIESYTDYAEVFKNRGLARIHLGQIDSGCLDLSKAGELGDFEAYWLIEINCN